VHTKDTEEYPIPELPEVETIRRSLKPIVRRTITDIYLSSVAPVEKTTRYDVRSVLRDVALTGIDRWGKYLIFNTDKDSALVIHLGMSGKLIFHDKTVSARPAHTHMEITFSDGSQLRYIDARRFGTLSLTNSDRTDNAFLARLGPDYLDRKLTPKNYIARCRRHPKISLKTLLLHQGIAAGLGNIYACEALYRAALDPRKLVQSTSDDELARLLTAAREILNLGIKKCGTSMRDYLDGRGHRGTMQKFLQVYGKENESTLDRRGMVKKIIQQGRSTYFCPEVQE